jgi:hypothetical protein
VLAARGARHRDRTATGARSRSSRSPRSPTTSSTRIAAAATAASSRGNLRGEDLLDRHVWVDRGDRTWMRGGTYLVIRGTAPTSPPGTPRRSRAQKRAVGREKVTGARPGGFVAEGLFA